jgi:hypothetical protein
MQFPAKNEVFVIFRAPGDANAICQKRVTGSKAIAIIQSVTNAESTSAPQSAETTPEQAQRASAKQIRETAELEALVMPGVSVEKGNRLLKDGKFARVSMIDGTPVLVPCETARAATRWRGRYLEDLLAGKMISGEYVRTSKSKTGPQTKVKVSEMRNGKQEADPVNHDAAVDADNAPYEWDADKFHTQSKDFIDGMKEIDPTPSEDDEPPKKAAPTPPKRTFKMQPGIDGLRAAAEFLGLDVIVGPGGADDIYAAWRDDGSRVFLNIEEVPPRLTRKDTGVPLVVLDAEFELKR